MTTLYDLRITVRRSQNGEHPVSLRLERHEPYPPPPVRRGAELVLDDHFETLAQAESAIRSDLLRAVRLPPDLADLALLGDPQRRSSVSVAWSQEAAAPAIAEVAQALLSGPGGSVLGEMRRATDGSAGVLPGSAPEAVGRVSLEVGDAMLWRLPWELLLAALWKGEPGTSCVVVRREHERAGTYTVPLSLPLAVHVYPAAAALRDQQGWADGLFGGTVGDYAHWARDMGGLLWQESTELPASGVVHHVAFSSDEAPGTGAGFSVADRNGHAVPIGGRRTPSGVERLATELERYLFRHGGPRPPRLLVLHNIAGQGTVGLRAGLNSELIRRGLWSGADAVLVVHCGSSDPAFGDLFPMFYRKVLHNWPLDQALLAALAQARSQGQEPLGWAFGARLGGELGLLLSEAVAAPTRSAAAGKDVSKGRPEILRQPWGRPEPALTPVQRSERAAAELQTQLSEATDARQAILEEQAQRLSQAMFDQEANSLAVVLDAQRQVREATEVAAASQKARAALSALPPKRVDAGTVRLTNLSLSTGGDGQGAKVRPDEPLAAQSPYTLHIQIASRVVDALVAETFPDAALTKVFERRPSIKLDVMIFSPPTDFQIAQPGGSIELPRYGPSSELRTVIVPQGTGRRHLRVCIYYQNTMLQSLWMEAMVVQPDVLGVAGSFSATVDYVASADLALLDELPRPTVNLFTNQTPQGDHWLGVFGQGDLSGFRLRSGDLYALSKVPTRSKHLRALLGRVKETYRGTEAGLDGQGHLKVEPATLEAYEKSICELASMGWAEFRNMFFAGSASQEEMDILGVQLAKPGLVSVARCAVDGATFPWAALYYLDIDTGDPASLGLCPVFKEQLARNRWTDDLSSLSEKADMLDDMDSCHQQSACPLRDPKENHTVCPFGFWGFVHQIEQPAQQIRPVSGDTLPPELASSGFNQNSLVPRRMPVRVALGLFEDENLQTGAHVQELEGLRTGRTLQLAPQGVHRTRRNDLIATMEEGGQQVYYFYCHGVFEEEEEEVEEAEDGVFSLKVGTPDEVGYIRPENLSRVRWEPDAPLVVLNGCQTVAVLPETLHDFLPTLHKLGASGVVGTEIQVFPGLARPFGLRVLRELLDGASLGEAFLSARLHLLRQYNPLGLAYSFYAPATLHLHASKDCAWCKAHPATRVGG